MINKELIKNEIERQIELNKNIDPITTAQKLVVDSVNVVLTDLLDYINPLPEEPVSEELEEAAEKYAVSDINGYDKEALYTGFKAGVRWQKEQFNR